MRAIGELFPRKRENQGRIEGRRKRNLLRQGHCPHSTQRRMEGPGGCLLERLRKGVSGQQGIARNHSSLSLHLPEASIGQRRILETSGLTGMLQPELLSTIKHQGCQNRRQRKSLAT